MSDPTRKNPNFKGSKHSGIFLLRLFKLENNLKSPGIWNHRSQKKSHPNSVVIQRQEFMKILLYDWLQPKVRENGRGCHSVDL